MTTTPIASSNKTAQSAQVRDTDWLHEWFNRSADRTVKENRWDLACQLQLISSYFKDMGKSPDRIVVDRFLDNINVSEEAVVIVYSVLETAPNTFPRVVDIRSISKRVLRCAVLAEDQKSILLESNHKQ